MSTDVTPSDDAARPADPLPRDAAYWAAPVSQLVAASEAARVRGLDGKRLMGPQQGFGQLWRRSHRACEAARDPAGPLNGSAGSGYAAGVRPRTPSHRSTSTRPWRTR